MCVGLFVRRRIFDCPNTSKCYSVRNSKSRQQLHRVDRDRSVSLHVDIPAWNTDTIQSIFLFSAARSVWATDCFKTSEKNFQYRLRDIPEGRRPQSVNFYCYEQCGTVHSVFVKRTNFFRQMRLQLNPVLQMVYSFSHSPFVQTKLAPYLLQYLLTGRFHHLQRHLVSGNTNQCALFKTLMFLL